MVKGRQRVFLGDGCMEVSSYLTLPFPLTLLNNVIGSLTLLLQWYK